MSMSELFIRRPIATCLIAVGVFVLGILAFRQLPVSALPEVDYPMIQVTTYCPGASAEVMTSLVTAPLERQLGQMSGLSQMNSNSTSGASYITLRFDLNVNLDVAEQEVQAALNAAAKLLPSDLPTPPIYNKVNPADAPIITLAVTSQSMPLPKIRDLIETQLAQKISQLAGVGMVYIAGGQRPAIRVQINPTALSAYGLTFEDVRQQIAASNINLPKGAFNGLRLNHQIDANDLITHPRDYEQIVISYQKGAPLYLRDVARVFAGVQDTLQAAWMGQTQAILLNIQRQPGANVIQVADHIKKLLPELCKALPASIQVKLIFDRTETIRASVEDAQLELLLSIALVVLVIFAFLRNVPATFIPSVTVPISLVGACSVMYMMGFSINNLTLMALVIAAGFVVDDAIVMIENISRYLEMKLRPIDAAIRGAAQISFTIISLTVSLIAVLIPLLFMGDVVGRLFREFAITLAVTIILSALISLILTPMLCAKILRPSSESKPGRFVQSLESTLAAVINAYARSLTWAMDRQKWMLLAFMITIVSSFLLIFTIPKDLFPAQDTGVIMAVTESTPGTSFLKMCQLQLNVAAKIRDDPAVEEIVTLVGIDDVNTAPHRARSLIKLKSLAQRDERAQKVVERLRHTLNQSGESKTFFQSVQDFNLNGRVSPTLYQYNLVARQDHEIKLWSEKLLAHLQENPCFEDLYSDQDNLTPNIHLQIDRSAAARFGVTPQMIDDILYDALGQRQITTVYTQSNQYYVVLEGDPDRLTSPDSLKNIYFKGSNGTIVHLDALASLSLGTGPAVISRQGQFPVAMISFNLSKDYALGEAISLITQARKAIGLPDSVRAGFDGAARSFEEALGHEFGLILAAIVVVYIVLGVLYESYIHPLTILSTLPSAGLGALLALKSSGYPLDIMALIGLVLLIGIVKKNAIMMIDFALEQERLHHKSPQKAIYEACLLRFRPILMTTLAALFGAVPLVLGGGMGYELRRPLGITIIGGLILSQIMTLYTTPVIYLAFDRLQLRCRNLIRSLSRAWQGKRS